CLAWDSRLNTVLF
nr:immunoglobulin light chain junction region [Macaca mulatta]